MMNNLHIQQTKSSPEVFFDIDKKTLTITGQSYPDNAFHFYEPLFTLLNEWFESGQKQLMVDISLEYMNTSSTKCYMDLFYKLEKEAIGGASIQIDWQYIRQNRNIKECGEEFKEDLDSTLIFNVIEIA
jgi:hypothetical protein